MFHRSYHNSGKVRRPSAFTIIEVLVVISIILVLIGILLPALNLSKEKGQIAVCASNMKQLAMGWSAFPNDHDDWIMHGMPRNLNETAGGFPVGEWAFVLRGDGDDKIEQGRLYPYVNALEGFVCPSEEAGINFSPTKPLSDRSYSIIRPMWGEGWSPSNPNGFMRRLTQLTRPGKQLVWVEENDYRSNWNVGSWILGGTDHWVDYVSNFHHGFDNMGYADGHVEAYEWQDMRTLETSELQLFNQSHPGSVDWQFMNSIYRAHNF